MTNLIQTTCYSCGQEGELNLLPASVAILLLIAMTWMYFLFISTLDYEKPKMYRYEYIKTKRKTLSELRKEKVRDFERIEEQEDFVLKRYKYFSNDANQ